MLKKYMLLLLLATHANNINAKDDLIATWVQYTKFGVEARAIVYGKCPTIEINNQSYPMYLRAIPRCSHPDKVCYAPIPPEANQIKIENTQLPVPRAFPKRILVIGDTGCRVSDKHGQYQSCNNPSLWPFARLANSAAAKQVDVILYTGDYIYRESACPKGNSGCKNTPWGDTLGTWKADWLLPAKPLQLAAPIIFTRGNHENCKRAGLGWFRYLGAYPFNGECQSNMSPWLTDLGNLQVAVMDSAYLKNSDGLPLIDNFADNILQINKKATKATWLLTHRPFWGYGADDDTNELVIDTKEIQQAVHKQPLSNNIQLIIGAHIHQAQVIDLESQPPQLIIGNSGTALASPVKAIANIDRQEITQQLTLNQYGFALLNHQKNHHWSITFYDQAGHPLEQCQLNGKSIEC